MLSRDGIPHDTKTRAWANTLANWMNGNGPTPEQKETKTSLGDNEHYADKREERQVFTTDNYVTT